MNDEDASIARRLVRDGSSATLATLATRPPGYPYGSLVAVACDDRGRPLLLISSLAEHTKNLEASPRASLLYADHVAPDPLASPRATVLGECRRVPDAEIEACRAAYLAKHPGASAWSSFRDFAFYRLEPDEVRLVVGFGKMSWIARDDYLGVRG